MQANPLSIIFRFYSLFVRHDRPSYFWMGSSSGTIQVSLHITGTQHSNCITWWSLEKMLLPNSRQILRIILKRWPKYSWILFTLDHFTSKPIYKIFQKISHFLEKKWTICLLRSFHFQMTPRSYVKWYKWGQMRLLTEYSRHHTGLEKCQPSLLYHLWQF